ncbi:cytochrome P450 [Gordonia sp. (in: high G+C Gram-positive bacteria)]|jgi:cytochrome P450|uniref:cytochrome P450 n=1 Tax=Gordonia sp. (in: high G+C Gram-positive bacteria) TaxID=84139 RepID=UPI00262573DD|nr:cytochrome P450 [Gordonia sp. (in: high G+C Gram-positive bacteria)]HMS74858.1 cytochrome P450 [Gordonia sp. (in: high G+C Gram-positive bacteria)]
MDTVTRFDPRISGLSQQVKDLHDPQLVYMAKARDVRAEYIDGALHLYRHEDILAVNKNPDVLGNGGRGGSFGHDGRLIPLEIDGPDHRKWRRVLDPMFSPKRVGLMEEQIRELARGILEGVRADGGGDLNDLLCTPLPCQTFLSLVGAPLEDLEFFLEFKEGIIHPKGETTEEIDANMAVAGGKLLEYFDTFLKEKRTRLDEYDDVIANLMRAEFDGEPINEFDLINVLFLLLFAGLDTVTASLSCILAWFGKNPDRRAELVTEPDLLRVAIEELVRFESPVPSGMRYPQTDIDLGDGLIVPADTQVNAFWAAANVDPTYHADPLRVDFHREKLSHMAFASGIHRCIGSHLARLELKVAVGETLRILPEYDLDLSALTYDNVAVRTATSIPVSV